MEHNSGSWTYDSDEIVLIVNVVKIYESSNVFKAAMPLLVVVLLYNGSH